jgi:hypothetical protein
MPWKKKVLECSNIYPTRCNVTQFIQNILIYVQQDVTLHGLFLSGNCSIPYVSSGNTTHHQKRKQLYLQHLIFVRPLLLPAAIAAGSSNGLTNTRCCRYSCLRFDDGWCYHSKHVEQFPDKNKPRNVTFCWTYIRIF